MAHLRLVRHPCRLATAPTGTGLLGTLLPSRPRAVPLQVRMFENDSLRLKLQDIIRGWKGVEGIFRCVRSEEWGFTQGVLFIHVLYLPWLPQDRPADLEFKASDSSPSFSSDTPTWNLPQLSSNNIFPDLKPTQGMEDLSNGWADVSEFKLDDLGPFDLTALAAEPRMFSSQLNPPSPPQAPPQVPAPRSTNVPIGTYESTARIPSDISAPEWRVVGVQELDPASKGHQLPVAAEPRIFSPSASTRIAPQAPVPRVANVPNGIYQSAAISPSATAAVQWRSRSMHAIEGFPSGRMSAPSCAAVPVVAPPHVRHGQSSSWQIPRQKEADTAFTPSIGYAHQGYCLQPGQHSADRPTQRITSQDQGAVCPPQRSTSHEQGVMCRGVSTLPAFSVHAGDPSDLILFSKYGIDPSKTLPIDSLSVSNQNLPRNPHTCELRICTCCHYCGGHGKGRQCGHPHAHAHAQTGAKEVKVVVVYLQSVNGRDEQ